MRNRFGVAAGCTVLAFFACNAVADHLPGNKIAGGKPDSSICGFDTYQTPLKDIEASLGERDGADRDPVHEAGVTYRWNKGPLTILVKTYEVGNHQDRPPTWIEVSGTDPGRVCPTGRGVALGDDMVAVRKAYGNRYGVIPPDHGRRMVTVEWKTLQTMDIDLGKEGRVVRINVAGEIE